MKTCPNCKTTGIPDDAQFCPVCGQPIISYEQIKMQNAHMRQQLIKEAEEAWAAYPNKPAKKKDPYSLLLTITLVLTGAGIMIGSYLNDLTGIPGTIFALIMIVLIVLDVIFFQSKRYYNPNEEIEKAKEKFISDYIATHKK